jgi:hypothetical protein
MKIRTLRLQVVAPSAPIKKLRSSPGNLVLKFKVNREKLKKFVEG